MNNGLSSEEIKFNQSKYGKNEFQEGKRKNPIVVILSQLINPLILLLIVATIISFMTGEIIDASIILAVIIINTVIGTVQELNAEKALEELKKISSPMAIVVRNGMQQEIPASELTVGDYIILDAGRIVPADIELTVVNSLKINESALTGESLPVEKSILEKSEETTPIADKKDFAFMSTLVTYGSAEGVVKAIGNQTEIGKIAKMLNNIKEKDTPLQKNLNKLSLILGIVGIILCLAMFGYGYFIKGEEIIPTLMLAISFAVAVIPEGLATSVTIVLALGIKKMVKKNAIVKQLQAVETLGAVDVICSDKTGTLTQNKMTVKESYAGGKYLETDFIGEKSMLVNAFVLCNSAKITEGENNNIGDPTEIALLEYAIKNKYNIDDICKKYPKINELPFDSDRKMMTTLHKVNNETMSFTKGAIESILPLSNRIYINGKIVPFTDDMKKIVEERAECMAEKALRVLVIGMRMKDKIPVEKDLVFIGFVGMIDPPKEGVKETIEIAHNAGIDVVMITGDHKTTAFAIAKELNICQNISACISGAEIDLMDNEDFNDNILKYNVFARVSPEHKVKIVQAFQNKGKVVSMTGDGVNDAPSLKIADIGVSMGKGGTDVAKGAADVILVDDNFITIVEAVKEGRNLFNNIKKAVSFLLRANFGEVVMMCTTIFAGFASPLSTIQILWVNLMTDSIPSLALGIDTETNDVMLEKPRNVNIGLFNKKDYFNIIFNGFVCGFSALIAFIIPAFLNGFNFDSLRNAMQGEILTQGRTFAFTTLILAELFMAYVSKAQNKSIFEVHLFDNKYLNISVLFGILIQILLVSIPTFSILLGLNCLVLKDWVYILTCALIPVVISEIKYIFTKRKK